jgi:cephalosporin hydroxylase
MAANYRFREFWSSAHAHYPEQMKRGGLLDQGAWTLLEAVLEGEPRERFVRPTHRPFTCAINGWSFPIRFDRPESAMALTYKGLINLKSPFDLALYSRLLWELQPRTIIELGSFQGGSGLWFADQMSVLCEEPAEVHSFDLHTGCRSEAARHPRLHFHGVDLMDLGTLDTALLERLPHPWLVVDDAHVNVMNVMLYLDRFVRAGDYYVIEDVPMAATMETVNAAAIAEGAGYLVDTHYTDAFGLNVTCAPNSWLRKS